MQSFSNQFSLALPYELYLAAGTEEQQRRWMQVYDIALPDAAQEQLLAGFERKMKFLFTAEFGAATGSNNVHCSSGSLEANPTKIDLRFVERE